MTALGDLHAALTEPTGLNSRAVKRLAIEALGDDPRGGRLADAAHPGEHDRMGNTAALEGVRENPNHGLLANQRAEILRPVAPGDYRIRAVIVAVRRQSRPQFRPCIAKDRQPLPTERVLPERGCCSGRACRSGRRRWRPGIGASMRYGRER